MITMRGHCTPLILVSAIFLSSNADACSCAQSSLPNFYEQADVVFLAEILHVFPDEEPHRWLNPVKATFNILETYKGEVTFPEIITPQDSAACGVEVVEGDSYLLFANDQGGVSICNGSGSLRRKLYYVKSLQKFQSGAIDELIEPWTFNKFADNYEAYCAVSRVVGSNSHGRVSIWKSATKNSSVISGEGGISLSLPEPFQVFAEDAHLLVGNQRFTPSDRQNERSLKFSDTDVLEVVKRLEEGASMSVGPILHTDKFADQSAAAYWNISTDDLGSTPTRLLRCSDWIDRVWKQKHRSTKLPG